MSKEKEKRIFRKKIHVRVRSGTTDFIEEVCERYEDFVSQGAAIDMIVAYAKETGFMDALNDESDEAREEKED